MDAPLKRLVGMALVTYDTAHNSLGLEFSGCVLRVFTPFQSNSPLDELRGAVVAAVEEAEGALVISFGDRGNVVVSLCSADYTGPEAFVAHFWGGPIVAQ